MASVPARDAQALGLILPTAELEPLLGDELLLGSAHAPEARVLRGYLSLIAPAGELAPTGALAAENALVELVRGDPLRRRRGRAAFRGGARRGGSERGR